MTQTVDTIARLQALKYRSTLYEVVATSTTGVRATLGYCRPSRYAMRMVLQRYGQQIIDKYGVTDETPMRIGPGSKIIIGAWTFTFGRTQREAIAQGELPPFV